MKLVRFGAAGAEKPGLVDADGQIRDLSGHLRDIDGAALQPESLARLAALDVKGLPLAPSGVRLGAPIARPWNFIAVGLNFSDHARETNSPIPSEPILFNKLGNCIVGGNDDVMLPRDAQKLDYEVEIAFVVGARARYVAEADAARHIAGYTICNDVSERHFQVERKGQWMKGKCFETGGPLGPWLVTPDEVDVAALRMWTKVNGEMRQDGSTANMIFSCGKLLSYISQFMVLEPGDVVTTGTPAGVALGMKPPVWLKAGDEVRMGIDGLGEQRQIIVPFQL